MKTEKEKKREYPSSQPRRKPPRVARDSLQSSALQEVDPTWQSHYTFQRTELSYRWPVGPRTQQSRLATPWLALRRWRVGPAAQELLLPSGLNKLNAKQPKLDANSLGS